MIRTALILPLALAQPIASRAATLVYLASGGVGQNVSPTAPQETFDSSPGGGSFHIWIQADDPLTGVSLDVIETGGAVRFTGATVHNPAIGSDSRWLPALIRDGDVTDDKVARIEGGAIVGVPTFGRGIGPATAAVDPLYEPSAGFLFATIDFVENNPGLTSSVSLAIGRNLFGDANGLASDPISLGVGDGPVGNAIGASGNVADMFLKVKAAASADFDASARVDGADFTIWQRGHGLATGATHGQGDATADGTVDAADLAVWQSQFGAIPSRPVAAFVPEPPAWALLAALASLPQFRFARRRRIC